MIIKKLRSAYSSQLRTNFSSGILVTILNLLITGVGYPAYLYFLGYEKYGVWLILATIISFVQLSNLGIGPAVMKLVAEEYAKNDLLKIQQYVSTATLLLIISGSIALSAVLLFRDYIISIFNLSSIDACVISLFLPYMGMLSIYIFIVQVASATLSGLGRMDIANYCEAVGRIFGLCVSLAMLLNGIGILSLFIGNALSIILTHITTVHFITKKTKLRIIQRENINISTVFVLLNFGGGLFGSSLINMLLGPFNKMILSRFIGISSVPIYEIAYNGTMQLRGLMEAGIRAISPEISKLSATGDESTISRIVSINNRCVKAIWLLAAPSVVILIVFSDVLLKVWLRGKFVGDLVLVFNIALIGAFISLLGVPAFYTLVGFGKTKKIFITNVILSVTNSLVVALLIVFKIKMQIYFVTIAYSIGVTMSTLYLIWEKRAAIRTFTDHIGVRAPAV
jgi:O-antigen/teichoic acid export membrane protein